MEYDHFVCGTFKSNGIVSQITLPSPLSSCEWIRRVKTAPANGTLLSTTWKIRRRNLRRGGGDGVGGGLASWNKEYSFLMISPKLYDISPFFWLILSPHWTADLLILIRLLGDGYSLLSSKKLPPRHRNYMKNGPRRAGSYAQTESQTPHINKIWTKSKNYGQG